MRRICAHIFIHGYISVYVYMYIYTAINFFGDTRLRTEGKNKIKTKNRGRSPRTLRHVKYDGFAGLLLPLRDVHPNLKGLRPNVAGFVMSWKFLLKFRRLKVYTSHGSPKGEWWSTPVSKRNQTSFFQPALENSYTFMRKILQEE